MIKAIFFFLMKTTGFILDKIVYKRKVYFEDKYIQKRRIKKGALLVSNHTSYKDYISYFMAFFFRKIYVAVGNIFYKRSRFLRFILKVIGGIKVNDNSNMSFIDECASRINNNKVVLIFPEAHYETENKINDFYSSYIEIALKTNAPIIPIYNNGVFSFFRRNRIIIGKPIYVRDYIVNNSQEEKEELNKIIRNKIIYLKTLLENKKKNHVISIKNILFDFFRIFIYLHIKPFVRNKIYYEEKDVKKITNRFIICSNHVSFLDPFLLYTIFIRRRIRFLTAKEVYHNFFLRFILKRMKCIKIDRNKIDIDAFNSCIRLLNEDKVIGMFPEGKIIENANESNKLKKGISLMSIQSNSPILPVSIIKKNHKRYIYISKPIYPYTTKYNSLSINDKINSLTLDLEEKLQMNNRILKELINE